MYVQPLLLCTTIYVNEGIYQNVCMCVQKTEMKVLIEWLWNRVPKTNHVGNDILSFDVYDSISHFNDGAIASLEVLKNMNMEPGDPWWKVYKSRTNLARYIQHTGCLNHNIKEEKLSDIVERKNKTKILVRRDQLTEQKGFENEWMYILLSIYFAWYTCLLFIRKLFFAWASILT